MAITIRKYNPGFLSDEESIASFCVRMNEFVSLVEMLRACTGNPNPHQLVIGPRGSGKTSLLRRVAAEIGRDDALSASFFPIVFAEESYEVSTAGEFWLECLSRLAVQAPHSEGVPDLHHTYEELRTIRDDQTLESRCLGALLDFSDREGKRLVLMVENLNMLFRDMADQDAGWRLRKVLQTEPRIILLASATSRFEQIDHPDQALYDLFRVLRLRPLDTQECAVLWKTVAGHNARPETIRSLQILTGGDPRLVVIVARFGAGRSFRNLMANLFDLVDDHTEYFKSHIELLPAQERRVYLALADLWKPATTKEIVDRTRLETSKCSAQLARLVEQGSVEVAGGTARRKQYYLTQRLYNIYYLLRRPRGPDRLVEALIRFMEAFYAPDELRDIGVEMVREASNLDGEMRTLHQAAIVRLLERPALAEHRDILLSEVRAQGLMPAGGTEPEWISVEPTSHQTDQRHGHANAPAEMDARKLIEKGERFRRLERSEEALAAYNEVVCRYGASEIPTLREAVTVALHCRGELFWELRRPEEALGTCDEVVRRYRASKAPALRGAVAVALVNRGMILPKLKRSEEALAAYDEVVRRYGASKVPALREAAVVALHRKGDLLRELERPEEALATCDEVVRRYGVSKVPALREAVAVALVNRGIILNRLERPEEALAVYNEVVDRYGASTAPALQAAVAKALRRTGDILWELERFSDFLGSCDEVVSRYGASEVPALREAVAKALVNKGLALRRLKRPQEALAACDEVVRRYGASEVPALREVVAVALPRKGDLLQELERPEEALAAYGEVVNRYGASEVPALRAIVARVCIERGLTLARLDRSEEALVAYDEVVDHYGDSKAPALQEAVVTSLHCEVDLLWDSNRIEEALAACDEVVRRYGASTAPVLQAAVAKALANKGTIFARLDQPEEALAACDEVVRRYGASTAPAFQEAVVTALADKGAILARLDQSEKALAACDEVVDRYGASEIPALQEAVAAALANRGAVLRRLDQPEEALAVCDEVAGRYGDSDMPELREAVAVALCRKGDLLWELERPEEALAAYDEVVHRLGENTSPPDLRLLEYALLAKASFELGYDRYEAAIKTAGLALEQCRAESLENQAHGHLIRARATLASGDPSGCGQDIKAFLALLPELGSLSREFLVALMEFSIQLGPARIHELIQGSSAAPLLLPLTTALEQELGLNPRVAREVDEVAQDIRKELEALRNANGRKG